MPKEQHKSKIKHFLKNVIPISLIINQTVSSVICFGVLYGMHNSRNENLNNCADAIGRALRHDAEFDKQAEHAVSWLKENFISSGNDGEAQ